MPPSLRPAVFFAQGLSWGIVLALVVGLAPACARSEAHAKARAATDESAPRARAQQPFRLPLSNSGPLRSYSWAPGVEVPWANEEPPREIPFGELGRTPQTLLYLGFNAEIAREFEAQPGGWHAGRQRQGTRVEGRQGGGLRLADRAALQIDFPEDLATQRQWTFECWVRPEEVAARGLFALPGIFSASTTPQGFVLVYASEVARDEEGRVQGVPIRSSVPLKVGEWNHVAVVLDLIDLHGLRLVVNGEARAKRLPGEPILRPAKSVVLGGGWARSLAGTYDDLRIQARAANTEEFQRALAPARPIERLALTRADGTREEFEVWTDPVRRPWLEGNDLWRRGALERVLGEDTGLRRVDGHWRRIEAADPPVARTTQASAFLGDHRILMFGGETRDTWVSPFRNTNDTWLFHTSEERWQRLELDPAPEARCHQAMALAPEQRLALMVSGFENEGAEPHHYEDTWAFDADALTWERLESEDQPPGLNDQAVVYDPDAGRFVYLYGTTIRTFDPAERRWETLPRPMLVDETGAPLDGAFRVDGSQMIGRVPSTGEYLLFGGCFSPQDEEGFVDEFYSYDPKANRLTRLSAQPRPSPRVRAGFGWDSRRERFVLFGGVRSQSSERMEDLWTLDPVAKQWKLHEASGTPSGRGGYYGFEYDPELDRFFLLCGRHSRQHFLCDVWTLALDESAPGRARFAFDRADFARPLAWTADLDTPGDSRVEFRFRAGDDGLSWGEWSVEPPFTGRYLEVEVLLRAGSDGRSPLVRGMGFR